MKFTLLLKCPRVSWRGYSLRGVLLPVSVLTLAAAPAFDPGPWLEDLEQSQRALAEGYANLEWAVFEREADLPRLFADAPSGASAVSARGQPCSL